uniref:Group II intron reverse transcriptase/maturase mat4b n=1 Tax=Eutreptiella eupharyngea TaxID=215702 RepID=A0A977PJB8_9EUGL|nr:putative group II intron reverse transcriptase/maturase mat4b [Eutreptiella eupharyngea]UXD06328.1 putative group II intron reverse transcriptase/maturase mat4b [Eutreptiella eupharyngea]
MCEYDSNWETTNWQHAQGQVSKLQYRIYKHQKILKRYYLQRVLIKSLSAKLLISELTIRQYKQNFSDEKRQEIINSIRIKDPNNLFDIKNTSRLTTILNVIQERLIFYAIVPGWYAKFKLKTTTPLYKSPHHTTIKEIEQILLDTKSRYAIQVSIKLATIVNGSTRTSKFKELPISPVIGNLLVPYMYYLQKRENSKLQSITSNNKKSVLPCYDPFRNLLLDLIAHNLKKVLLHLGKNLGISQEIKVITAQRTNKIFLFHRDIKTLREMFTLVLNLSKASHSKTLLPGNAQIIDFVHGISLYNFKIHIQVINRRLTVSICPDEKSQRYYLKMFSQISHYNRTVSTYTLITLLRPMVLQWATYFQYYNCKETFVLLNYKSNQILRAWVFRRDKKKGRNMVKEVYFPSGNVYKFPNINQKNNWVLCGIINKNPDNKLFLPQLQWLLILQ